MAWGSGPKGETPAYTGVDFTIARDGKIAALGTGEQSRWQAEAKGLANFIADCCG